MSEFSDKDGRGNSENASSTDTQQMVEAVQAMFPHIPERSIRYDLLRSGSAEITCEKILQDGFLPTVRVILM